MTGSGTLGRIISLSRDTETIKEEKVWKFEPKSEFPVMRKKTSGIHCKSNAERNSQGQVIRAESLSNKRQNFGTVVTTEGMWMIGGLISSAADLPTRAISDRYNIDGCMYRGHMNDVWVFNPKGWSRDQILGDAKDLPKYNGLSDSDILPTISGYEFSRGDVESDSIEQSFDNFRLYDEAPNGLTVERALEEGWECTGIDGNWCRKPFLNRYTKGAESQVMCFEYEEGEEDRSTSSSTSSKGSSIPKRPRFCPIDETNNPDNNCICYIIQASGQQGPKQTPDGAGFRPEIDYLEVRRADGTYGSQRGNVYEDEVHEYCPDAQDPFPNVDDILPNINQSNDPESAVNDPTQCTSQCGGQGNIII